MARVGAKTGFEVHLAGYEGWIGGEALGWCPRDLGRSYRRLLATITPVPELCAENGFFGSWGAARAAIFIFLFTCTNVHQLGGRAGMPPTQIVSEALSALRKSAGDTVIVVTPFPSLTPTFGTRAAEAVFRMKTWNKSWRHVWAIMVDDHWPQVACLKDATCVRAWLPLCNKRRMAWGRRRERYRRRGRSGGEGACVHHRSMGGHRRHRGAALVGVTATA